MGTLVILALFVTFVGKVIYMIGAEDGRAGLIRQIDELPYDTEPLPAAPMMRDRPYEQAGFLMMQEGFIDNPPEE